MNDHVAVPSRHEVPPAVYEHSVRLSGQTLDRSRCRHTLCLGHAKTIALGGGRVPDCPIVTPLSDPIEHRLTFRLIEEFGVSNPVDSSLLREYGNGDRERTCPGSTADLVDPRDDAGS